MGIHFFLLVNKQGQTRLAQYANYMELNERVQLEGEVVRKCLQRKETECSFIEHLNFKLIYRRYASLFFIVGMRRLAPVLCRCCVVCCPHTCMPKQASTTTRTNLPFLSLSTSLLRHWIGMQSPQQQK